jgi:hypothetical protein
MVGLIARLPEHERDFLALQAINEDKALAAETFGWYEDHPCHPDPAIDLSSYVIKANDIFRHWYGQPPEKTRERDYNEELERIFRCLVGSSHNTPEEQLEYVKAISTILWRLGCGGADASMLACGPQYLLECINAYNPSQPPAEAVQRRLFGNLEAFEASNGKDAVVTKCLDRLRRKIACRLPRPPPLLPNDVDTMFNNAPRAVHDRLYGDEGNPTEDVGATIKGLFKTMLHAARCTSSSKTKLHILEQMTEIIHLLYQDPSPLARDARESRHAGITSDSPRCLDTIAGECVRDVVSSMTRAARSKACTPAERAGKVDGQIANAIMWGMLERRNVEALRDALLLLRCCEE